MTHNVEKLIKQAAQAAISDWGGTAEAVVDLIQDLWVWYLESPGTRQTLGEMEVHVARRAIRQVGMQILAGQALEGDVFQGRALYSSEAVKDALKGRSTNKHLPLILSAALRSLEARNEEYREALRSRYDDGIIPQDESGQGRLKEAHRSITAHVNIIAIEAGDISSKAVEAETRQSKGAHGDPTGDMVIALIEKGDAEHELKDKDGNVEGSTTLRAEALSNNLFDTSQSKGRPVLSPLQILESDLTDGIFNGGARSEMYRAAVFPDLYPHEKPMLIENWTAEDREMYCGGIYTPGYLRLVK